MASISPIDLETEKQEVAQSYKFTVLMLEPRFEIQINGSLNIAPYSSVGLKTEKAMEEKELVQ